MRKLLLTFFVMLSWFYAKTQNPQYPFKQLYQLDSIRKSTSISKYFGELYFTFLQSIEKQLTPADSNTKKLIRRFEAVFAQFYIDACEDYKFHQQINITDWQSYFSDSSLTPIQYKLLGTNAHLNGRLWEALANSFTLDEMDMLKKEFVIFKKSLNKTYRYVYREATSSSINISMLRTFSFGIDKFAGYYYLYKWRRRQMKLARFYLSNSSCFNILLANTATAPWTLLDRCRGPYGLPYRRIVYFRSRSRLIKLR